MTTKRKVISLSLVLVAGLIVCLFVFYLANKGADNPEEAITSFILELKDKKFEEAHKRFTNEASKIYTTDDLIKVYRIYFEDGGITAIDRGSIRFGNGETEAIATVSTVNNGNILTYVYSLRKTLLGWKIMNIQ